MGTTTDQLIEDYLRRLTDAAVVLPTAQSTELLAEIREHLDDASRRYGDDDAAVRTALDRLGEPEDIIAAARQEEDPVSAAGGPTPGTSPQGRRGTGLEIAAVLLLTAGSFVPFVGWLAGAVLLWVSGLWKWWEKLLGTLIWPFGPGAALLLSFTTIGLSGGTMTGCSSSPVIVGPGGTESTHRSSGSHTTWHCTTTHSGMSPTLALTLIALLLAAPFVVDGFLLVRARRRARAGLPVASPTS